MLPMQLLNRVEAVASAAREFPWLGDLTPSSISRWIELELGKLLEASVPQAYDDCHCFAQALNPILHVVSGNTPHAGIQSLIRGILVGAKNRIKLPRQGLPELDQFVRLLPEELRPETSNALRPNWMEEAEAIVVFGSDETVEFFAKHVSPRQRLVTYGHRISLGLILDSFEENIVDGAARDVLVFDQLGCLSPQLYYVAGDSADFARKLAERFKELFQSHSGVAEWTSEIAGTLRSCREEWKFRAATEPGIEVWESPENLDWLVIHDPNPNLISNPLYRTIFVKPLPGDLQKVLSPIRRYISTIGIHPVNLKFANLAARLGAQRVCPIGGMQKPAVTWHHDGGPTLANLVRFVDIEGLPHF
jgi:Acyl-CoA reductase (LuxC)